MLIAHWQQDKMYVKMGRYWHQRRKDITNIGSLWTTSSTPLKTFSEASQNINEWWKRKPLEFGSWFLVQKLVVNHRTVLKTGRIIQYSWISTLMGMP